MISFRFTSEERALLDQTARKLERSRGDVIRRAIRAFATEIAAASKEVRSGARS